MINVTCTTCGTTFSAPQYRANTAKYCSPQCRNQGVAKVREIDITVRFWGKVNKRLPSECWPWTGATTHGGYGVLGSGGKHGVAVRAHRFSYTLAKGGITEGLVIRHTCDNPACVNPEHLVPGTQADNMRDAIKRGRRADKPRKLTEEQVQEIRNSPLGTRELARQLNVSPALISGIRTGRKRIER